MGLYEKIVEYHKNTPQEEIDRVWKLSEDLQDSDSITIDEFMEQLTERQKELNAKHQRDWYQREKKKKIKKNKLKAKQKRYVEKLTDSYVRKYLKLHGFIGEITQDLIEIQRQSLLLKRELR